MDDSSENLISPQPPAPSPSNDPGSPFQRQPAPQARAVITEICPVCHQPVTSEEYFCPNCGHPLRAKPPGVLQQVWVYLISLFLPPFGLWYTWRYLKAGDKKSRIVGIMTIVLTVVSIIATLWLWQAWIQPLLAGYTNQQNQLLNQQLNGFGL